MALSKDFVDQHISDWQQRLTSEIYGHRKHWPSHLFHHSPLENAVAIVRDGCLRSRNDEANQRARDVAAPGVIDTRNYAHDFVRLYFRPKTPTQWNIEGTRKVGECKYGDDAHAPVLVMFMLTAQTVLSRPDIKFSNKNMQLTDAATGDDESFFGSIPFVKVFSEGSNGGDKSITDARCAEVLCTSPLYLEDTLRRIGEGAGYRPGRFLLTGSANVLTSPRVADSRAGRIETIEMLPLARAEIEGNTPTFLERLFDGRLQSAHNAIVGDDLVRLILLGGFPEALARESERRRQDWARSYLNSVLTRDLRDIADIEKLTELPKFVRLLAEHSGQLVNYSQLGGSIGVSHKTGQRYVGLLEQVFLVSTLQPWFTNALKRISKTPKLHFLDSGLLATTRGLGFDRIKADRTLLGPLLESFVFSEVLKLMAASDLRLTPYHFRDQQMREVDIVLASPRSSVTRPGCSCRWTAQRQSWRGSVRECRSVRVGRDSCLMFTAPVNTVGHRPAFVARRKPAALAKLVPVLVGHRAPEVATAADWLRSCHRPDASFLCHATLSPAQERQRGGSFHLMSQSGVDGRRAGLIIRSLKP